jgi:hypothetical protein
MLPVLVQVTILMSFYSFGKKICGKEMKVELWKIDRIRIDLKG